MNYPEYNGIEEPYTYNKKLASYINLLNKEKYNEILLFVNNWLNKYNITYKLLTEFSNVPLYLINNTEYNKQYLLDNHKDILNKLNINETIDITKHCIFTFLKLILKKIHYKLVLSKTCKNQIKYQFYTIKKI